MQVYICDDSKQDREQLKAYFFSYANTEGLDFVITEFESAEQLLKCYTPCETEPTVVFLDIYMQKLSGMQAAKELLSRGFSGNIIFTTTSPDHAIESYEVNADGYLKKPYSYLSFTKALQRCKNKWTKSLKTLNVLWNRIEFNVLLQNIDYIESGDHCSYIHVNGEIIKANKTISQIENELREESSFLKCSRSYIINMNRVSKLSLESDTVKMKSGEQIAIPVREKVSIRKILADYFWSQARETER